MTTTTAPQVPEFAEGDIDNLCVSFVEQLQAGETISTATVTEVTSTDLTISNVAANSAAVTITVNGQDKTVAIMRGVQMTISGQLKATRDYTLKVVVTTSLTRTLNRYIRFVVNA